MPEAGSTTAELSLSPLCPAGFGCNSARSHREQARIALTMQVAQPGGRKEQQQKPPALEILHSENPAEQNCVLLCLGLQFSGNEIHVPHRRLQDGYPLPVRWQSLVTFPPHCGGVCNSGCLKDAFTTWWESATLVPDLRLPSVQ